MNKISYVLLEQSKQNISGYSIWISQKNLQNLQWLDKCIKTNDCDRMTYKWDLSN
jgi:hypothetical protein